MPHPHRRLPPCLRALCAAGLLLPALAGSAAAATRVVVFPFELLDTSGEAGPGGPKPEERHRLALITNVLRDQLARAGYQVVDTAPQQAEITEAAPLNRCNRCELPIARALDGQIEVVGYVQKVSNLILNINFQLRDVADGQVLRAGSVDIRGNTDDDWRRGVSYLIRNRLMDPPLTGRALP